MRDGQMYGPNPANPLHKNGIGPVAAGSAQLCLMDVYQLAERKEKDCDRQPTQHVRVQHANQGRLVMECEESEASRSCKPAEPS